ncbi:MAG: hypothetical protein ACOXZK_03515 [Bacteroidales bacterium]|jgi:hypothetical protein|nr:hypothetical protein [Bacteroidales bacterium]
MKETKIIGIIIKDRIKEADKTQKVLSKYASIIDTRLGTHELNSATCSRKGIILLILRNKSELWTQFEADLSKIEGIEVKNMTFNY